MSKLILPCFFTWIRQACKQDFCPSLCIKDELGDDDNKKGAWTARFARAPDEAGSDACMDACFAGCSNMVPDDDD